MVSLKVRTAVFIRPRETHSFLSILVGVERWAAAARKLITLQAGNGHFTVSFYWSCALYNFLVNIWILVLRIFTEYVSC